MVHFSVLYSFSVYCDVLWCRVVSFSVVQSFVVYCIVF